tara:strand:+ start:127 stop:783 length:657 start_codon:yes stop_codon:yes gene_type:complete
MGNRRMGAQRLASLMKRGAAGLDTSYQAGNGIKNAIVSHKMFKFGGIIETQILVDLQGKSGISIFSATGDDTYIGEATAADGTGAVEGVHLLKYENDVHGDLYEYEVIVVELPQGGADDLKLSFDTYVAAHKQATSQANVQLSIVDQTNAWQAGDRHIVPIMDEDLDHASPHTTPLAALTDVDGDGLYLSTGESGTAAAYTDGKLLIILRGYDTQWGF